MEDCSNFKKGSVAHNQCILGFKLNPSTFYKGDCKIKIHSNQASLTCDVNNFLKELGLSNFHPDKLDENYDYPSGEDLGIEEDNYKDEADYETAVQDAQDKYSSERFDSYFKHYKDCIKDMIEDHPGASLKNLDWEKIELDIDDLKAFAESVYEDTYEGIVDNYGGKVSIVSGTLSSLNSAKFDKCMSGWYY